MLPYIVSREVCDALLHCIFMLNERFSENGFILVRKYTQAAVLYLRVLFIYFCILSLTGDRPVRTVAAKSALIFDSRSWPGKAFTSRIKTMKDNHRE